MNMVRRFSDTPPGSANSVWQALPPGQHLILIYAGTESLLDNLEGFVSAGLLAGEGVIVLATTAHRVALQTRLLRRGFDLESARARHQYLALDAPLVLPHFGGPRGQQVQRFAEFFAPLVQARAGARRVRVFGGMASVLWGAGRLGATFQLEQLGEKICAETGVMLMCAYPMQYFLPSLESSLQELCMRHTRVLYA